MEQREEFDVIIVGYGCAGVSAAIEARDQGASVLILDRAYGGGATAQSGGVMYAGGGTPYQKEAGYEDTPDNMFNYLKQEVGNAVSDETLRRFCEESRHNLEWLEKQGAQYESSLCTYKTSYPTDRHYLYFSGNELSWPYREKATPAPRGHRQIAKGMASGHDFFHHLKASAEKKGVIFKPLSMVDSLIIADGVVKGVTYRTMANPPALHRFLRKMANNFGNWFSPIGKPLNRWANNIWKENATQESARANAVILSAGGFVFNREMVKEFAPEYLRTSPLGTTGDDGSGINLGRSAGGAITHMDRMTTWRFITPPPAFMEGIAIGLDGKRFINEDLYGATFSEYMVHQHNSDAYLIVDRDTWQRAWKELKTKAQIFQKLGIYYVYTFGHKKATTLEKLAEKINVPYEALKADVDAYNDGQKDGGDPLHKMPEYCSLLEKAPFYAIDISPDVSPFFPAVGLSLGGLKVDEKTGAVLNESGEIIKGLYAAGRNAAGICANSYISGLSLADGVFSGRRAGFSAVKVNKN